MTTSPALFTARALVDELARGGVRRFCVAPGSRSTPLALAVAERDDLASHVATDERSLGFFALGFARATRQPVGLVCTSGTAVAGLLPAAIEATLGGGALVLLTADRPPELRDTASPQTIHQAGLFGRHARWACDVPLLEPSEASARALRSIASRAVATATSGDGGAVHLNVPLREPFVDDSFPRRGPFATGARDGGAPFARVLAPATFDAGQAAHVASLLSGARRGVVVCAGAPVDAVAVAELAARLGWPVVADPMSGLRHGDHDRSLVVDAMEPLLRDDALRASLRPDAVLRFGLTPAPRSVQRWLDEAWPATHVVVADGDWPDPVHSASLVVRGEARPFCDAVAAALPPGPSPSASAWSARWLALSAAARRALETALDAAGPLFDGVVVRETVAVLPDDSTLVLGNSMPVRDADAFLAGDAKRLRVVANRGASGIDGVLSTALGYAAASSSMPGATPGAGPASTPADGTPGSATAGLTALVVGDLSFLHDATALAFAARERIPLLVVVVNNDGGGIFSHLPLRASLAESGEDAVFERFFGTPHGADLAGAAALAGVSFRSIDARDGLGPTLAEGVASAARGPAVVEVRTDRAAAREAHLAAVRAAVQASLRADGTGGHAAAPIAATDQRRNA